MDIILEN